MAAAATMPIGLMEMIRVERRPALVLLPGRYVAAASESHNEHNAVHRTHLLEEEPDPRARASHSSQSRKAQSA
jgi:hypothetical protein